MSKYLSHKITILYTLLIVMVLYIHSYYKEGELYPAVDFIQHFWGWGICSVANCLFFAISGYLFARNLTHIRQIWSKQKKRFRTLIMPYLLWNLIFVLWYVVLEHLPGVNGFNNSGSLANDIFSKPVGQMLYALFLAPAAFQMWFLRDLIFMVALTPLLWWLARKNWIICVLIAAIIIPWWGWLMFYWLGIIAAVRHWDIENYPRHVGLFAVSAAIVLAYAVYLGIKKEFIPYAGTLISVLGLYVVWYLYDLIARGRCSADHGIWAYICGFSFFVYCFHEPAFNILKKLSLILLGNSQVTVLLLYFINPWIMLIISILVARFIYTIYPPLYKFLTGGR